MENDPDVARLALATKKKQVSNPRQIYVAPELNARLAEYSDVDWSAVACEAFETKLGQLAAEKKEKSMRDVIDRLRASANEADNELLAEGRLIGEDWAKSAATARELRRLSRLRDSYGSAWDVFANNTGDSMSPEITLANTLLGQEDDHNGDDAEEHWELILRDFHDEPKDVMHDPQFVRGFVDGALDVWDRVKDQI